MQKARRTGADGVSGFGGWEHARGALGGSGVRWRRLWRSADGGTHWRASKGAGEALNGFRMLLHIMVGRARGWRGAAGGSQAGCRRGSCGGTGEASGRFQGHAGRRGLGWRAAPSFPAGSGPAGGLLARLGGLVGLAGVWRLSGAALGRLAGRWWGFCGSAAVARRPGKAGSAVRQLCRQQRMGSTAFSMRCATSRKSARSCEARFSTRIPFSSRNASTTCPRMA